MYDAGVAFKAGMFIFCNFGKKINYEQLANNTT